MMQHSRYASILATEHASTSSPLLHTRSKTMALEKLFCLWNTDLWIEMSEHIWQA